MSYPFFHALFLMILNYTINQSFLFITIVNCINSFTFTYRNI